MAHTTARLALTDEDGTDPKSGFPNHEAANNAILDLAALTSQGTISGRPGIGTVPNGYVYTCTDAPIAFVSVNGAWLGIPLGGGTVPIGGMIDYAGSTVPTDQTGAVWHICDGSTLSRTTYAALYAAIGTTWGAGDGSTTFTLPDFRGRTAVGAGAGAGLTNRALAATGGEEAHALSVGELASHGHGVNDPTHAHSISDPGHAHGIYDPGHAHVEYAYPANLQGGNGGSYTLFGLGYYGYGTEGAATGIGIYAAGTGIGIYGAATGISIAANGSGSAHNTMQPFAAANKAIRIQ